MAKNIGLIESWDDAKGFGFIHCDSQKSRIFLHISALTSKNNRPQIGSHIEFELTTDKQGKLRADKARLIKSAASPKLQQTSSAKSRATRKMSAKKSQKINTKSNPAPLLFATAFIGLLAIGYLHQILPLWPLVYFASMSVITFLTYAWDKRAARLQHWRVSEAKLQLFSLLGGWPGALYAQQWLRHKSAKGRFKLVLWFAIIGNLGLIYLIERYILNYVVQATTNWPAF
ncbi:DUF1294 domain-containing protein [Shewanella pneumatophori]|uniref:DUF1294 domain-containing protein n=1 Tax=Shewanella pneumatophori TaxID=314092 RepID=A0A9X1ZF63_9GAMM|nr:DUF1294 domain-containing protein [Shewanella pneumatophori]MCL1138780.1 DUF1294 domain-containing protein [Shewanella pneumatophori]